jgi:hypothetical protein
VVIDIDLENAVFDFDPDLVAYFGVVGANGDGVFTALAEVEVDATRNAHGMKGGHRACLGISIVDDLPVLGYADQGGKGEAYEEYSIFHVTLF